jgi:hypothetical protein
VGLEGIGLGQADPVIDHDRLGAAQQHRETGRCDSGMEPIEIVGREP